MISRRARSGLLLAALLLLGALPARAAEVVEATLENGLKVLLLEDHRSPVISLQIWYRVGSRNERIGLSGLSHYLEHMMFKGTSKYGPRAYARLVEEQGGQENAFTAQDATTYFVNIVADKIELILDLEAERMRHLLLEAREVDAERKVILEERRTRTEDDPIGTLAEELNAVAFKAHPYRIPPIGFMDDIQRITAQDLRRWYDTYYVPNNAVLVAVGDFVAAELLAKIRARFEAIPRSPDPPAVQIVEPAQRGERRVWVKKEAQLPVIFMGYHTPNITSPDAYALEVTATILSAGRTSRLYRRLVYEERLALDAGGDYTRLSLDPDMFTFYATVLPGKTVEDVERVLLAEVERLRTEPVGAEELQRAKNQLESGFVFGQDSVYVRASTLARHELVGSWRLRDEFLPRIRAVTARDIQDVARRYFVGDHQTTAILVPVPPAASQPAR
ncbi:MAG TPA: pitrilysin family protein [Methylomirabilota bacterium]|nr:pitrilysin family protein [Methylomirabilota bacterium]